LALRYTVKAQAYQKVTTTETPPNTAGTPPNTAGTPSPRLLAHHPPTKSNRVIFRVQLVVCLHRRCRRRYSSFPLSIFYICIYLNMSMQMLFPRASLYEYIFIEQLVKKINKHAKKQGYSITRKRSKQSKKDVLIKI